MSKLAQIEVSIRSQVGSIPDLTKFHDFIQIEEGKQAMREDGLKVETMRMLVGRFS